MVDGKDYGDAQQTNVNCGSLKGRIRFTLTPFVGKKTLALDVKLENVNLTVIPLDTGQAL